MLGSGGRVARGGSSVLGGRALRGDGRRRSQGVAAADDPQGVLEGSGARSGMRSMTVGVSPRCCPMRDSKALR